MWASWMDIAFAKLDANGDGFISLQELLARLPDAAPSADAADEGERLNAVRVAWDISLTNCVQS